MDRPTHDATDACASYFRNSTFAICANGGDRTTYDPGKVSFGAGMHYFSGLDQQTLRRLRKPIVCDRSAC